MVRIRDHPFMNYRGDPNWPPAWTQRKFDGVKTAKGEVGDLIYIHNVDYSLSCYLVIKHENEYYVGTLRFNNVTFCRLIVGLLRQHIDHSIKEIGDLEISGE